MTPIEFKLAKEILFDPEVGKLITTDMEISESLKLDLLEVGVNVVKIAKRERSRNKYIHFTIKAFTVKGTEMKFLTIEDAQAWKTAKNKSIATLSKAPDEAFMPVECEEIDELLWWNQAMGLAYRLGSKLTHSKDAILIIQ
jgi:hypothetical protein